MATNKNIKHTQIINHQSKAPMVEFTTKMSGIVGSSEEQLQAIFQYPEVHRTTIS